MRRRNESVRHGGDWLGAVRNWIQWHCGSIGSRCTWGSDEPLKEMTVREVEEIGATAVEADREELAKYPRRRMLVFDNILWDGKDENDNSRFWKEAFILREYGEYADVLFIHSGRVGRGHFRKDMRLVDDPSMVGARPELTSPCAHCECPEAHEE